MAEVPRGLGCPRVITRSDEETYRSTSPKFHLRRDVTQRLRKRAIYDGRELSGFDLHCLGALFSLFHIKADTLAFI
jgi:hypothetical protein